MHKTLVALAVMLAGCQATVSRATGPGAHVHHEEANVPERAPEHRAPVDPDVVEKAARPFAGVRVDGGALLAPESLLDELAKADVVCVGEDHADPYSHFAELAILQGLSERAAMSGRELGLGIEMLPKSRQPVLERWRKGDIGETELLSESNWKRNWGYDFSYYRPQLEAARSTGLEIVALNVSRELTRKVAREGLGALTPNEEQDLPTLDLSDRDHRAWFERQMRAHPMPHAGIESLYAAQVLWDEAMAENACRWIGTRLPGRQMVLMAGAGHCRAPAIPRRLARRCAARVVGVRPTVEGAAGDAGADADGFDFLFRASSP